MIEFGVVGIDTKSYKRSFVGNFFPLFQRQIHYEENCTLLRAHVLEKVSYHLDFREIVGVYRLT